MSVGVHGTQPYLAVYAKAEWRYGILHSVCKKLITFMYHRTINSVTCYWHITINRLDPFVIHRPVSGQGVQQTCIKFTGNAQARFIVVYALLGSLNFDTKLACVRM